VAHITFLLYYFSFSNDAKFCTIILVVARLKHASLKTLNVTRALPVYLFVNVLSL